MSFLFFVVIALVALIRGSNPSAVSIDIKNKSYQNKLDPALPFTLSTNQNRKYKGFKNFLEKRIHEDSVRDAHSNAAGPQNLSLIRAAFYTPWSAKTALPDLEKNGSEINTIFPEWFLSTPTITTNSKPE